MIEGAHAELLSVWSRMCCGCGQHVHVREPGVVLVVVVWVCAPLLLSMCCECVELWSYGPTKREHQGDLG